MTASAVVTLLVYVLRTSRKCSQDGKSSSQQTHIHYWRYASILLNISVLYSETSTVCRTVGIQLPKDAAWYLEGVDT